MVRTNSAPQRGLAHVRTTLQRDAVSRVLRTSDKFRTAQDIHAQMRLDGESAGLTTVYRHLQIFVDEGVVHTVQLADRQTAYRWCGLSARHHHLVCRSCGASLEFEDMESEQRIAKAVADTGFKDLNPSFDVFGVCPECQR